MRLIEADALDKDYRIQFERVYKSVRDSVKPSDYFIERKAAYDKELIRLEMEAFCEFIQSRPTIDAEPVRHGRWEEYEIPHIICCSECDWGTGVDERSNYCPNCGAKMDGGNNDDH